MRMRLETVEPVPKEVFAEGMTSSIRLTPQHVVSLTFLKECIEKGETIPRRYYRSKLGQNVDQLLQDDGYMHFHLDSPRSRVVLFAAQYEEAVVFLGVRDHYDFEKVKPPGKVLNPLFKTRVSRIEAELTTKREEEASKKPEPGDQSQS